MKNLEIQDFFIKKLIVGFLVRSRVIFSENPDGIIMMFLKPS